MTMTIKTETHIQTQIYKIDNNGNNDRNASIKHIIIMAIMTIMTMTETNIQNAHQKMAIMTIMTDTHKHKHIL